VERPHHHRRRAPRRRLRPARIVLPAILVLVGTVLRGAVATPPDGSVINAAAVKAITVHPEADATVSAGRPDDNFGLGGALQVLGGVRMDSYLRFKVPAGAKGRALLRLWVLNPTTNGPGIRRYEGPLNEAEVTWDKRPTRLVGNPVESGALQEGTWAEWDVTRFVTGPGALELVAVADSVDAVVFGSRESAHSPQLVFVPPSAPTTTPTTAPTPTTEPTGTPTTGTTQTTVPTPTPTGPPGAPACRPNWAPVEPMSQLRDGLGEMSAFVASPTFPGWGWGIRDSGRPASLYAFKPESADLVAAREFSAAGLKNSDWEDMAWTPGAEPGTGHLWVLENVGNGWTGNRWIYQFDELDPRSPAPRSPAPQTLAPQSLAPQSAPASDTSTTTSTTSPPASDTSTTTTTSPPLTPASLVGTYEWKYPDDQANTETMFVFDGDLVVVTKTEPSRVYRFDGPLVESVINVPSYVGTLPVGERLSVAALSLDQRTLAVSSHGKLNVYENRGDRHNLKALISNPVVSQIMPPDNREGGSFFPYGSCDLLLVAESKTVWRLEHR
jgi:hypothetical protein